MMFSIKFLLLLIILPLQLIFNSPNEKISPPNASAGREMLSFDAISDGKKVIVNWTSPAEESFDYYTVEKSKDGINFYPALMIKSAGKFSNLFEYTDVDYSPFSGISYYRLRQNDYFGEFIYSDVTIVNCQLLKDGTIVSQSEKVGMQKEIKELEGKPVLVVLRNSKGMEFTSKILVTSKDEFIYALDTKNQLAQGDYFVVASSCNPLYHQKLTVK